MAGQNRSNAVMASRVEVHDSLDDFPTPPWATRALLEWIEENEGDLDNLVCREPAANRGHMARVLAAHFGEVVASDVHDYGSGYLVKDYLFGDEPKVDWTITNPPFRLAEEFVNLALKQSQRGVAMIVRTAFLEGVGRYERLFSVKSPAAILQFSERVVMHKGKLTATGSTATAYCWVVWLPYRYTLPAFEWIPPCRKRLERASDYPVEEARPAEDAPLFGGQTDG